VASRPRKVVVLGSSGFIGNALAERFRQTGKLRVIGLRSKNLDLSKPDAWKRLAKKLGPDVLLIHAARPRVKKDQTERLVKDIAISFSVSEALRAMRVWKAVYLSSTAVYGDGRNRREIRESDAVEPSSAYGYSKWCGERLMQDAVASKKNKLLILRPCMVFGPGNREEAYGPNQFISSLGSSGRIRVYGDGKETRSYIYIDDFCEIAEKLALGSHQGVFNLAGPVSKSFSDLARQIPEIAGRKVKLEKLKRSREAASQSISSKKLRARLRGVKFTPFQAALKTTWENDVLKKQP